MRVRLRPSLAATLESEGPDKEVRVAVASLVASRDVDQPNVGPDAAERLAGLGISHVALLQDPLGVGIVVEGWAFDPARIDEAVQAIFPNAMGEIRTFHEIEHVAVSVVSAERRT